MRAVSAIPNRYGKVESAVNRAHQMLKGLRFESIDEALTHLDRWEGEIHAPQRREGRQEFE